MSNLPIRIEQAVERMPALEQAGTALSRTVHQAVLDGGEPTRKAADFLHGTWLGHSLHAVLTDVTVGTWVAGAVFDMIGLFGRQRYARRAGSRLASIGTASAVPTLLSGLADFSTIPKPAVPTATLHALTNGVNLGLYLLSIRARRKGNWERGVLYSTAAIGLSVGAAWLGGHLVYRHRVGVDQSESFAGPEGWTAVLPAGELAEGGTTRVEVDGKGVLLHRCDGAVRAIGSVCSHAGGPLDEGRIEGCYVQCPWHDSVFDLRDGSVRHGPATHPQPSFEAREREGQIELRLRHSRAGGG